MIARPVMHGTGPRPLVGVATSIIHRIERTIPAHGIGQTYLDAVVHRSAADPFLIPSLGEVHDARTLARHLDGLFLPGGRSNIEPHHYDGPPFPDDEICDPARDSTVLPLIRACVEEAVPVFGVCRGIQEINVALGGTLHYRVHQIEGKLDHRMPQEGDMDTKFGLRHPVSLAPGGSFGELVEATELMVNSAHGQGIDRLADDLVVEALAPDGIIEGVRIEADDRFVVGVQWHAEWRYDEHDLSQALFVAFGTAARHRATTRHGRVGAG